MSDGAPLTQVLASDEERANAAFAAEEAIKETVRRMRSDWRVLAGQLYQFAQLKQWKALGYKSFEQWLASPEIDLERRSVFYLLEAHRELVVERGVEPGRLDNVQVSKVRDVLPAIRRGQVDVETALSDAETLGRDDLREKYSGVSRPGVGPRVDERPLDATTEPERIQCESCGSWYTRRAAA